MEGSFSSFGINFMDREFTQCLVFFEVKCSPLNS